MDTVGRCQGEKPPARANSHYTRRWLGLGSVEVTYLTIEPPTERFVFFGRGNARPSVQEGAEISLRFDPGEIIVLKG